MKKILLTFILMFTLIINIDALTIKEDSSNYTGDVYIFGSTKFDNNTLITFTQAGIAGMNEAKVQLATKGIIDTDNVKTYYYSDLTKSWNEISLETGKLTVLTDEQTEKLEENLKVYYVNNVEKIIEVPFEGVVDENTLKPISSNITSEATTEEGKILVPATWVNGFTFTTNGIPTSVSLSEIVAGKINELDSPIIKINPTLELTAETSTVRKDEIVNLKAIYSSNGYANTKGNVTITGEESVFKATYNKEITLNNNEENITLKFTKLGNYTIKYEVVFENGITLNKTLNFKVIDNGTLKTSGTTYTYENNTLTLTGTTHYRITDVDGEEPSGNYVSYIRVTSPDNFDSRNSKIKLDGVDLPLVDEEGRNKWIGANMENSAYSYWFDDMLFTDKNTTHTLEVEWFEGYTETFLIKLGETCILEDKPESNIGAVYSTLEDNTLTVNSIYYTLANSYKGYIIPIELTIQKRVNNPKIIVDNTLLTEKDYTKIFDYDNNKTYFTFSLKFDSNIDHKVEVTWGKNYTETYTVKLGENALKPAEVNDASFLKEIISDNSVREIKLTDSITLDETLSITNKDLTIDLNENQITFTSNNRLELTGNSNVTIKNGTLYGGEYALAAFDNSTLTVEKDVLIDMTDTNVTNDKYGIYLRNNANVTLNGTINVSGTTANEYYGISGNGSYKGNTTLTVNGNINSTGAAIYEPQTGTITINEGAYLEANTVIGMKAGKLTINGGTLYAVGENNEPTIKSNGFNLTGDVIYLEENASYDGNIEVTVNAGNLDTKYANIIRQINSTEREIKVTGEYKTETNGNITIYKEKMLPSIEYPSEREIYIWTGFTPIVYANDYFKEEVNYSYTVIDSTSQVIKHRAGTITLKKEIDYNFTYFVFEEAGTYSVIMTFEKNGRIVEETVEVTALPNNID